MSISFTLRESVSGFRRAKLASIVSILTICVSLFLLAVFAIATINAARLADSIRNKIEIEAFLQEPLTQKEITVLKQQVTSIEGVDSVQLVSKEQAAKIFLEEFGEDIHRVLEFNPLPPSFKISLKNGFKTSGEAQRINDALQKISGIDEVVYRKALLELIDKRTSTVNNILLGLGLLISLSAVLLVSNTIRLIFLAKRSIVHTMELIGATRTFIRIPFLLEGMLQGLVGGVLVAGSLYLLLNLAARFLTPEFSEMILMDLRFYLGVVLGGICLGSIGGIAAIIRFVKPSSQF